ncbi:MAG: site-2 protease family protein [Clostridia bacterium]|nr:site-2 protease family protein [Clostridia bacterium]
MLISAPATEVFKYIGYVLISILALLFMIVIHEFGHYLAGKLLGFKIKEFAIGFGPKIFKITNKKNNEIFSLRCIPLGGFCQFYGESDNDENGDKSFDSMPAWKRIIVLFSGAFFNFVSSIIIITLVFTFFGQIVPKVNSIQKDSYIGQNNILIENDAIISINHKYINILNADDISSAFSKLDETGTITIIRNGEIINIDVIKSDFKTYDENGEVVLDDEGNEKITHGLGITIALDYVRIDFFRAIPRAIMYSFFIVYKIFLIIGMLFTGKIGLMASAGGMGTIVYSMSQAIESGFGVFSYIICILSANLAVMNLLPIPSLDGSKILLVIFESIFKKKFNRNIIAIIDIICIFALIIFAIVADITRFINF